MDGANRNRANAKFHIIAYGGHSPVLASITDCYSMTQRAIAPYNYVRMDEYISKMIDS